MYITSSHHICVFYLFLRNSYFQMTVHSPLYKVSKIRKSFMWQILTVKTWKPLVLIVMSFQVTLVFGYTHQFRTDVTVNYFPLIPNFFQITSIQDLEASWPTKNVEMNYIQGAAFNVTQFQSRITHLLYTAINTTEHGQVSQCLGFTKRLTSSLQRLGDVLHDNQGIAAISQVHLPWRDIECPV